MLKEEKRILTKARLHVRKKYLFVNRGQWLYQVVLKTNFCLKNSLKLKFSKMLFVLSSATVLKGNLQPKQDSLHRQLKLTAS